MKSWEIFYLSWSHQQPWSRPPTQPAWWRSWIVYQDYVLEHLCDLYSYILEIYFATKKVCCTVAHACSWEIFPHNGTHPVTAFEHFSSMSFSQFFSVSIVPWVNPLLLQQRNSCVHVKFKQSAKLILNDKCCFTFCSWPVPEGGVTRGRPTRYCLENVFVVAMQYKGLGGILCTRLEHYIFARLCHDGFSWHFYSEMFCRTWPSHLGLSMSPPRAAKRRSIVLRTWHVKVLKIYAQGGCDGDSSGYDDIFYVCVWNLRIKVTLLFPFWPLDLVVAFHTLHLRLVIVILMKL